MIMGGAVRGVGCGCCGAGGGGWMQMISMCGLRVAKGLIGFRRVLRAREGSW